MFTSLPQKFIETDNRRNRHMSKSTVELTVKKFTSIFDNIDLTDKTVLDIGCCVGALGYLLLQNGVKHYTGVDIQKEYVNLANENLSSEFSNDKFEIICSSFDDLEVKKYDIVLAFGVLYSKLDAFEFLKIASSFSSDIFIVEGVNPQIKNYRFEDLQSRAIITLDDRMNSINLSDFDGQIVAPGARLTPKAIEVIMNSIGFEQFGPLCLPAPINKESGPDSYNVLRSRYFLKFKNTGRILKDVTQKLKTSDFSDTISYKEYEDSLILPETTNVEPQSRWSFNTSVSSDFNNIAKASIPDYERVNYLTNELISREFPKDSHIVELGCSNGFLLNMLAENGFTNISGVDYSPAMLTNIKNKERFQLFCSNNLRAVSRADVVVANWTVQFNYNKKELLSEIFDKLAPGGLFILTEKCAQSPKMQELYYEFKRGNGISDSEIIKKEQMLRGAMFTHPVEWYFITLREIGFRNIEIANSLFSFNTFIMKK